MKHPKCGKETYYDSFEDMYFCPTCDAHCYPHEMGAEENPAAGFRRIGKMEASNGR
jgi:hypothetical protein